jgi:hypothetical protein
LLGAVLGGGLELLLGLGDVVARTRSARDAVLELMRVAVLEASAVEQARGRGRLNKGSSAGFRVV